MNEFTKCFWEKGRGEIEEIFRDKKGNLMVRDWHPLAGQHIRNLNDQSDRLKNGKIELS